MFTGLIQALGKLQIVDRHHLHIRSFTPANPPFLADLALGDSVAVDGMCLTVETLGADGFGAATSPETWQRTTLGEQGGDRLVNLEPALRVGDKLGGHFVTGHVDGVGYLEQVTATDQAWELAFHVPQAQVTRYILPKGSIAVNGISLTIARCSDRGDRFQVAVIPHTFSQTNLQYLQPGQAVNLEGDILGKYVEKLLTTGLNSGEGPANSRPNPAATALGKINPKFLAEHGYL